MNKDNLRLHLKDGSTFGFLYNKGTNLLLMLTAKHLGTALHTISLLPPDATYMNVTNETNQNLAQTQWESLQWH